MERYKEVKVLGKGTYGSASLCIDTATEQKVVVKTLNKAVPAKKLTSFQREVAALRQLDHPNIIKYIDSFEDERNSFIVMEYADGGNLEDVIVQGPLNEQDVVRFVWQLLSALAMIHDKKIVHKDIKPENVLLDSEGNAKLADFGIAKILEYEGDMGTTIAYSRDCVAPELFVDGKYDTKYDIFGLGILAYKMLFLESPFASQGDLTSGKMKPFPKTSIKALREIITKMLDHRPKKRPAAKKLLKELSKVYTGPVEEPSISPAQETKSKHPTDGDSTKDEQSDLKIMVVGIGDVGKSALTIQFVQGYLLEGYDSTVEDSYKKIINVDGEDVQLDILDIPGQDDFAPMRRSYMRQGKGFLLVYSIDDRPSFKEIEVFYQEIYRTKGSQPPIVICGNNCDREDRRSITKTEGLELSRKLGCSFFETSPVANINIENAFVDLVRQIKRKSGPEPPAEENKATKKKFKLF